MGFVRYTEGKGRPTFRGFLLLFLQLNVEKHNETSCSTVPIRDADN